jgi:hypothetical protein
MAVQRPLGQVGCSERLEVLALEHHPLVEPPFLDAGHLQLSGSNARIGGPLQQLLPSDTGAAKLR